MGHMNILRATREEDKRWEGPAIEREKAVPAVELPGMIRAEYP